MKNLNKILLPFFAIATASVATPSLDSKCNYPVETPPNGSDVIFDESCQIAYVLPPLEGIAKVGSLARTTNLQFCPAIKSVNETTSRMFNSMNIISQKIEQMIEAIQPLNENLIEDKIALDIYQKKMQLAKRDLDTADKHILEIRKKIRKTREDYEGCVEEKRSADACLDTKNLLDQMTEEIAIFRREEYNNIKKIAADTEEDFEISAVEYNIKSNQYINAITPMIDLQEKVFEFNSKISEHYRDYLTLDGAYAQVIWSIPWDVLIHQYRDLNPDIRVKWQRLPIKEANLIITALADMTGRELSNMSGLKSAAIPGANPAGFSGIGAGQKVEGPQLSPSSNTSSIIFGNSISGQIVLNLMGACPYFDGIDERNNISTEELSRYLVANLAYTWEVAVRRGYTATYNLSNLMRKIEQKAERGGLFSTHAAHSIINDDRSGEWFSIKFDGNSSEFKYGDKEQAQLIRTLKEELFDKAFKQFAVLNAGAPVPPRLPQSLKNGAQTAAAELNKCWNLYCQAGSALLGVGNSIWGESHAVANFYRNNNAWATEKVDGVEFVSRSSSLTFGENYNEK